MIELSNERIEKILHEETMKTEPLPLLLRAVFNRYRGVEWTYLLRDLYNWRAQVPETGSEISNVK